MLQDNTVDNQTGGSDQLFIIPDESGSQSIATDDLPSTNDLVNKDKEQESLLYSNTIRPPKLNHGGWRTDRSRPGWKMQQKIICYQCYIPDKHIAPECDLKLSSLGEVITNYEKLTADDRSRVPDTSYKWAKQLLSNEESKKTNVVEEKADGNSKN